MRRGRLSIICLRTIRAMSTIGGTEITIRAKTRVLMTEKCRTGLVGRCAGVPIIRVHFRTRRVNLLVRGTGAVLGGTRPRVTLVTFRGVLYSVSCVRRLFSVQLSIVCLGHVRRTRDVVTSFRREPSLVVNKRKAYETTRAVKCSALFCRSAKRSLGRTLLTTGGTSCTTRDRGHGATRFRAMLSASFGKVVGIGTRKGIVMIGGLIRGLLKGGDRSLIKGDLARVLPKVSSLLVRGVLDKGDRDCSASISIEGGA